MSAWEKVSLETIAESVDYGVTASAVHSPIGPKFLRITDIQDDRVDWSGVPWCASDSKSLEGSRLRPGDIVFARTGATTGKSFYIEECPADAVFASYLIRVRVRNGIDSRYVSQFFKSADYWAQISKSVRGVAQPGVNATTLKSLKIPLPPFLEQERIAAILNKAEILRTKRREALAQLDRLTQSIFVEHFGDPAINPKGWPWRRLGSLAQKFSDGPFGSNLKSEHYVEDGVRVVRLQNIGVGEFIDDDKAYISEEHFRRLSKHECAPGDILVGTLGDPNLRACVLPESVPLAINKADCVQIRVQEENAHPTFLCALLNNPSTELLAQSLMHGQTRVRISMGSLRELNVPVPPLSLQLEFAERIRELGLLKSAQLQSAAEQEQLFVSLQRRAFAGAL